MLRAAAELFGTARLPGPPERLRCEPVILGTVGTWTETVTEWGASDVADCYRSLGADRID